MNKTQNHFVVAVCQDAQLWDWLEEHERGHICCFLRGFPRDAPCNLPQQVRISLGRRHLMT